ncbi:hypothetical protein FOZ61_001793 [Perkinsus olseni]|uniref:Uncharacterized protein n=2 Tax=Perkinsus olseni TaxID=32597 RepID=A0A7J6KQ63_PEROL|nr:hypothetical protein FOZ61_001793 [Perkinsus olseni]
MSNYGDNSPSTNKKTYKDAVLQDDAPSGTGVVMSPNTAASPTLEVYPSLEPLLAITNGSKGPPLEPGEVSASVVSEPSWFKEWYASYYTSKDWSNPDCTPDFFVGKTFDGSDALLNEFNDVFFETVKKVLGVDGINPWLVANPLPHHESSSWSSSSSSSKKWDHGCDVVAFCKDWSLKPYEGIPSTSQGEYWWSQVSAKLNTAQAKCPHPALILATLVYLVPSSLTKELRDKWLVLISNSSEPSGSVITKWVPYVGTSEYQVDSWSEEKQRKWTLDRKLFTDYMKESCRNLSIMLSKRFVVPEADLLASKISEYLNMKWSTIKFGVVRFNDIVMMESQVFTTLAKLYKGDIYEILSYASRLKVMMELIYHPLEVMITDDSLISVRQMLYEAMSFSYMVYGQTDYPKEPKLVFQQLLIILNKVDYGVSLCTYDYFSAKFYEAEKAFKNSKKDDYQKPNSKKNKVYDNVSI